MNKNIFINQESIISYNRPILFCIYPQVAFKKKLFQNWAFLTRFCFLSEEGQFEYQIDFNEDQGDLNLLLYYDTDDQWPAVYKSNKVSFK